MEDNKYINKYIKILEDLKSRIFNLKIGQRIPIIYVVREKISNPHGLGDWEVSDSVIIYKDKSFPLRKEKYYFIPTLYNDTEHILSYMLKSIGKKYNDTEFIQGYSLREVYKMLDSIPNGMIPGSKQSVWYGHYISKEEAEDNCKKLSKPYKISTLKNKIESIENDYKNLDNLKNELARLEKEN